MPKMDQGGINYTKCKYRCTTTAKQNITTLKEFYKPGCYNTILFAFIFLPKLLRFGRDGSNKVTNMTVTAK